MSGFTAVLQGLRSPVGIRSTACLKAAAPVRELDVAGAVRLQGFRSPLARSTACLLYVARFTGYRHARHQAME